jgi:hypothetical protein
MFRPWLNELKRRYSSYRRRGHGVPLIRPTQPRMETLEVRLNLGSLGGGPQPWVIVNTLDSGTGSLRQVITNFNTNNRTSGQNPIFNIPASDPGYDASRGVFTISLQSALPTVSVPLNLDATTESGFLGSLTTTPIVVLDGTSAGTGAVGLTITGGSSTVTGLVIDNFKATAST